MASSILSSPESRRLGQTLASMQREIDTLRAGQQQTQLGNSTLYGAIYIADPDGNVKGIVGEQADGSTGVVVTDGPAPPRPNTPSLTPLMSGVDVAWSGTFAAAKPLNFSHVNVYLSDAGENFIAGPSNLVGTLSDAGSLPVAPLPSGTQWWARLVAVNTSVPPKMSEASFTVGPVSPDQVVAQDVLDGIVTEVKLANDAVTAAKIAAAAVGTGEIAGQAVTLSQLASGSVDATKLTNGAVTQPAIAANAVTANALAANSVIAGKLAADSVSTTNLIAESVQAETIAAGAVLADKIAANAVTAAAINALAVTADKVAANAINAGHITAGAVTASKLAATLILGTTIVAGTSTTGARVTLNSSGIEAFRSNGMKVLDFDTVSGDMTIAGRYRSQDSGERIEINPGGSDPNMIRLYYNGQYARISAESGPSSSAAVLIQGSSSSTGRLGAYNSEAFVSWVSGNISRSAVSCRADGMGIWSVGDIDLFHTTTSSQSPIASSRLRFSVLAGSPTLTADGQDSGIKMEDGGVLVVNGGANAFRSIFASAFVVSSSESVKENVRDARRIVDFLAVTRQARARSYTYRADKWRTPPATEDDPDPAPVLVEAPTRIGPIAEELPPVLVTQAPAADGSGTTVASVNLADEVGVLWGAFGQIQDQEIRSIAGRAMVPAGTYLAGRTVTLDIEWDEEPLEVPTGGIVVTSEAIAWLGKTTARIVPGSLTLTGCTVEVRALAVVSPSTANPITCEAQALYLWNPPYEPEGA